MTSIEENTILFNIDWQVFLEKLTITRARSVETGIIVVVDLVTEFSHSHTPADMQAMFDGVLRYIDRESAYFCLHLNTETGCLYKSCFRT